MPHPTRPLGLGGAARTGIILHHRTWSQVMTLTLWFPHRYIAFSVTLSGLQNGGRTWLWHPWSTFLRRRSLRRWRLGGGGDGVSNHSYVMLLNLHWWWHRVSRKWSNFQKFHCVSILPEKAASNSWRYQRFRQTWKLLAQGGSWLGLPYQGVQLEGSLWSFFMPLTFSVFYTPVWKTDVLCRGNVRPSVRLCKMVPQQEEWKFYQGRYLQYDRPGYW